MEEKVEGRERGAGVEGGEMVSQKNNQSEEQVISQEELALPSTVTSIPSSEKVG